MEKSNVPKTSKAIKHERIYLAAGRTMMHVSTILETNTCTVFTIGGKSENLHAKTKKNLIVGIVVVSQLRIVLVGMCHFHDELESHLARGYKCQTV